MNLYQYEIIIDNGVKFLEHQYEVIETPKMYKLSSRNYFATLYKSTLLKEDIGKIINHYNSKIIFFLEPNAKLAKKMMYEQYEEKHLKEIEKFNKIKKCLEE